MPRKKKRGKYDLDVIRITGGYSSGSQWLPQRKLYLGKFGHHRPLEVSKLRKGEWFRRFRRRTEAVGPTVAHGVLSAPPKRKVFDLPETGNWPGGLTNHKD